MLVQVAHDGGNGPTAIAPLVAAILDERASPRRRRAYAAYGDHPQRLAAGASSGQTPLRTSEHSDWEAAHNSFTYCNALHQLWKRRGAEPAIEVESRELLRGVFHGAMRIYLTRLLNLPPARLPGEPADGLDGLPSDDLARSISRRPSIAKGQ